MCLADICHQGKSPGAKTASSIEKKPFRLKFDETVLYDFFFLILFLNCKLNPIDFFSPEKLFFFNPSFFFTFWIRD